MSWRKKGDLVSRLVQLTKSESCEKSQRRKYFFTRCLILVRGMVRGDKDVSLMVPVSCRKGLFPKDFVWCPSLTFSAPLQPLFWLTRKTTQQVVPAKRSNDSLQKYNYGVVRSWQRMILQKSIRMTLIKLVSSERTDSNAKKMIYVSNSYWKGSPPLDFRITNVFV